MLLVIMAGLLTYIAIEHWYRQVAVQRMFADKQRAVVEYERAQAAAAQQAKARMPAAAGPTE
jgi:hypothetical protein